MYATLAVGRSSAQALKAIAHNLARVIYALCSRRTAYNHSKLEPSKTERAIAPMTTKPAREAEKLGHVLQRAVIQTPASIGGG